ncbi:MAG TPA: YihY/virulence factor BrkB family protein [Candidatus Acidoferrales bacterium]|nr:YihY/virulence factor BrkB family protein [Candidatus Acidoferrales bacterium]
MISFWRLIKEIFHQVDNDDCVDLAAQMAFFFSLSLLPFLVVIAALVGMLPSTTLWHNLAEWLTNYLPRGSRRMVFMAILGLTEQSTAFLSFGLLATLWTSSSGFVSLMESLSKAYGARDTRSFWRKRVIALIATVLSAVLFILSFGLMAFGHRIAGMISAQLENAVNFSLPWEIARWGASLILMMLGLDLMNYFLPNVKRGWRWITPGNAFIVLTTAAGSAGFNFYLSHFGSYPRFYGAMAGFIILVTWIYVASFILLVGAEIDSTVGNLHERRPVA